MSEDGPQGPAGAARLTLLCHASTDAVRAAAFPLDEPLDALGRAAALALAGQLAAARIVLTSPARRAVETAEVAGLAAKVDPALRDIDHGRWAGLTLDAIAAQDPQALGAWLADPDAAPHGGEPISALIARVGAWMDGAIVQGRVLAVTHPAVIRAAVIHALGAPATAFWRIDAAPLSRVELRRHGGRWALQA